MVHLHTLLEPDTHDAKVRIANLEAATGRTGVDVAVNGDLITRNHSVHKKLGLDPLDTNPAELYTALCHKIHDVNDACQREFNINSGTVVSNAPAIIKTVNSLLPETKVRCLTRKATKNILQSAPPEKTLEIFEVEDVSALIKFVEFEQAWAVAKVVENQEWIDAVKTELEKLTAKDFRQRDVDFVVLPAPVLIKLKDISKYKLLPQSLALPLLGSVVYMPWHPTNVDRGLFYVLAELLHAAHTITTAHSLRLMIGLGNDQLSETVIHQFDATRNWDIQVAGVELPWELIHRTMASTVIDSEFYGNARFDDWLWRRAELLLALRIPELKPWLEFEWTLVPKEQHIISAHPVDIAYNIAYQLPYDRAIVIHGREALWHELLKRYSRLDSFGKQLKTILH